MSRSLANAAWANVNLVGSPDLTSSSVNVTLRVEGPSGRNQKLPAVVVPLKSVSDVQREQIAFDVRAASRVRVGRQVGHERS